MLDGMRRLSQGLVGRVIMTLLFLLLIGSFAIWGIGDMFRGFTSDKLAEVGGQTITAQQFQDALQTMLVRVQSQMHSSITNEQARALGFDSQVLRELISDAALDERARALGLAVSDEAIVSAVRSDPNLQDASGQFDRARFDQALRQSGLSERGFFAEQNKSYLRQQIGLSLTDGLTAPKKLVDFLARVQSENRAIDYFVLPPSAAGDIAAPTDDALKGFFEDRKDEYRAPEYRAVDILFVNAAALAKPEDVTDEDAKADYDKLRDTRFTTPEKRKLQQIVFPDQQSADDAEAKIKAGASFDDIVKARNLKPADVDLGETTKTGAYDPAIGEAAFALPEGGVSGVVKGQFGPAIVHVVAITPGAVKSFDEVKAQLKGEIAADRVADQVQSLHDKVEDARVSGKSLAEAAKSLGLEIRSIPAVDSQGKDPSDKTIDLPDAKELVSSVFASDVGVDDAPLPTKDRGWLWFDILKIVPAHERAFDEVKDKVAAEWRADESAKALAAKAADMVKQVEGGATLTSLAQAAGQEVQTASDIRRGGKEGLAPNLVSALFNGPADGAGSAAIPAGRVIFKVMADATPTTNFDDPTVKSLAAQLGEGLQTSLVDQYINALETELGVRVNQSVLQAAEGS
ncbi:MAG: peptidylprolyl isomerase [Bradyrhizobium sp.]|nr:MAG: peptidylprolyl isomerase [Bradyrhizobium sp.]